MIGPVEYLEALGLSPAKLKRFKALIAHKEGTVYTALGQGEFGIVWDIGDGKVLKLTKDELDARIAVLLSGERNSYFPQIHKVFQVSPTHYCLIVERLEPISEEQQEEWSRITTLGVIEHGLSTSWLEELEENYVLPDTETEQPDFIKKANLDARKLDALRMWVYTFEKLDVKFTDVRGSNIMLKNGCYALVDFGGYGSAPDVRLPHLDEHLNGGYSKILEKIRKKMGPSGLDLCGSIVTVSPRRRP